MSSAAGEAFQMMAGRETAAPEATSDQQAPVPLTDQEREELLRELRHSGGGVPESQTGAPQNDTPTDQYIHKKAPLQVEEDKHVKSLDTAAELKKLLGLTDATNLRVGVCCSGGGMRAFYESVGFLAGLEDAGILPSVAYVATLSGSAWMQWAFLASEVKSYREFVAHAGSNPLTLQARLEWTRMAKDAWQKKSGLIDVVAAVLQALILEQLVGRKERIVNISKTLPKAQKPYPVSTFIKLREQDSLNSEWFEASPHEVVHSAFGATIDATSIATKYFGCVWDLYGYPKDQHGRWSQAEDDLAFLMAICGSAYGAQVAELVKNVPESAGKALKLWAWCNGLSDKDTVVNPTLGDFRPGRIPSMPCTVRDAGIALNLPFLPLLRRKCNVIIVKDASAEYATPTKANPSTGAELRRAALWAQRWGFVDFPTPEEVDAALPKGQLGDEVYHVTGKNKIHVLYVPRFTDVGTFKMCWPKEASEAAVKGQREFVVRQRDKIVAILKSIADSAPK